MKLIVGLGNPGREYAATRHNVGFDTITALCDKYNIRLDTRKFKGLCGSGYINGQKVLLIQPQTYMNNSGECIREAADFFKVENEDIAVICDDINLDVGRLRIRGKGSAGGHNGLKSIIAHLGGEDFPRFRIGVGKKPDGWDLADHVLARFPKEDDEIIREMIKLTGDAVAEWIASDIGTSMNKYNSVNLGPEADKEKEDKKKKKKEFVPKKDAQIADSQTEQSRIEDTKTGQILTDETKTEA